jgi:ABC-type thiamin/hydroxymethylpyrimidine transport system permease subunit
MGKKPVQEEGIPLKMSLSPKKFLRNFSIFELIVISICAAIGVAVKPVMVTLVQIITGPLFIPGGTIVGGFYMMWLVVSAGLVGKRGTATLTAVVQSLLVLATGVIGTHGIMTLVTYIIPGIAVDILLIFTKQRAGNNFSCFFAGMAANSAGALLTNLVFFRLPAIPLILVVAGAALSGGLGGLIAYAVIKGFRKVKIPGLNSSSSKDAGCGKTGKGGL